MPNLSYTITANLDMRNPRPKISGQRYTSRYGNNFVSHDYNRGLDLNSPARANKIRALYLMMLILVLVNLLPMIYLLMSDPKRWITRHQHNSQVANTLNKPEMDTQPILTLKPKPNGEKLILFLGFPEFYKLNEKAGPNGLSQCNSHTPFKQPIKCELTTDARKFNQSDAVVFYSHGINSMSQFTFTPKKYRGQTWTFFAVESPIYSENKAFSDPQLSDKFNSTMTYRTDSDFLQGYIRAERREFPLKEQQMRQQEQKLRWAFRNKTRMAAIFLSHCTTQSQRASYIKQLKTYMDIDVFGACGHLKCESHAQCDKMLVDDYKFYLAFENALCTDYVTEKLLRSLSTIRVVSVVRGGADYTKIVPPNSVIDAGLYFSPTELAFHLKALAEDEDGWVRMFQWTQYWRVLGPSLPLCTYCYHLVKRSRPNHLYANIYDWWNKDSCFRPNDL